MGMFDDDDGLLSDWDKDVQDEFTLDPMSDNDLDNEMDSLRNKMWMIEQADDGEYNPHTGYEEYEKKLERLIKESHSRSINEPIDEDDIPF